MLRLIFGPAKSGKTTRILNEMRERASGGGEKLYMLVPDQYSHTAERMLCAVCGNSISLHGEVLTFNRLALRILGETGAASIKTVNNAGRMLLMSRALQTALPDLQVFSRHTGNAAFVGKLVETASEFKSACLTAEDVRAAASRAEYPLDKKLADLALILEIYWSLFGASDLEPEDLLEKAAERIGASSFASGVTMWIDGFADFSTRQLEMIGTLLGCGAELTVCLTCDGLGGTDEIFETTRKTAAQLLAVADRCGAHVTTDTCRRDDTAAGSFGILESVLSGNRPAPAAQPDGAISVVRAATPVEECEYAAAQTLELVRNGLKWQDISIVCCSWDNYRAAGRSVFSKYGIPVYINEKTDILALPPVALISAALRTIITGWEYSNVFRYIKTGLLGITHDECDMLENYVLKWGVRGSQWYGEAPWTMPPNGYDAPGDDDAAVLERLNDIRERVRAPLAALQTALSGAETVREKLGAVYAFLTEIDFASKLDELSASHEERGETQLAATYSQIWDAVIDAMDQFCRASGDVCYDLPEFLSLWELVLSQYDIGTIPPAVDTVAFGDLERVRRRGTRCLIVLGATDDALPHLSAAPGIFSDYERDTLIVAGLALRVSTADRISRDLFAGYSSLMLPDDRLVLTYPSGDMSGGEKRPSPIVTQLCEALGISPAHADPGEFRLAARVPCVEQALLDRASVAGKLCAADGKMAGMLADARSAVDIRRGSLTPRGAASLYGTRASLTASRMEKFYSCRYMYFLKFGLRIKQRRRAELDPLMIGTFIHAVLQNTVKDVMELGGFKAVSNEKCVELTEKHVANYIESELGGMDTRSGRYRYIFRRIREDAVQIVLDTASELRRSDFEPIEFELGFAGNGEGAADGEETKYNVSGVIDRVDGWLHDGRIYLRVIDYKSGRKSFSLSEVWNGIGTQMLIYLFALEESWSKTSEREIVPAGLLYVPARDVMLSVDRGATDAEIADARTKALRRSGLVLDDADVIEAMESGNDKRYIPVKLNRSGEHIGDSLVTLERLGRLSMHIDRLLARAGEELLAGCITADPYFKSQQNDACSFCDYRQSCSFGEYPGDIQRHITNLKTPQVWDLVEKEAER